MQNGPTRGATGRERRRSLYIPGWSFPFLTQNESLPLAEPRESGFLAEPESRDPGSRYRDTLATVRLLLVALGLDVFLYYKTVH